MFQRHFPKSHPVKLQENWSPAPALRSMSMWGAARGGDSKDKRGEEPVGALEGLGRTQELL